MKTFVALTIALAALVPVSAQVFRPETVNGAILGGIAGAVIGNNSGDLHHNAWKGAAIGTVAGALIGSAVDESRAERERTQVPMYAGYRAYSPSYRGYGYRSYGRPSYAANGLFWGGLAGAVIGRNSHWHNGWRGAAWGAGAGWLLGTMADEDAAYYPEPVLVAPVSEPAPVQTAQSSGPQNVTIINNYYGGTSASGSANSLFGR